LWRPYGARRKISQPLRPVLRKATAEDLAKLEENREKEKEALETCERKIAQHRLEMNLVGAEYTLDRTKLIFYFTAEGRVDFRQLVRDLSSTFKTRIELRQIGVRDEAKMLGGLGSCGRQLCCCTFLSEFQPVSIRMAKRQDLSLNPAKISGLCGRLMCCLRYECDYYPDPKKAKDLSHRVERLLGEVDLIAAENPRHTLRLLNHLGFRTPLTTCNQHSSWHKIDEICRAVESGRDVALVTDAGLPGVSDPGWRLVREAAARGLRVVPVPGPSALVLALAGSGLPTGTFVFDGFLPRRPGPRRRRLEELGALGVTIVIYESPYRVVDTLEDVAAVFGEVEVPG